MILAGHSMGGGIALRYAEKPGLPPVDGYLLLAPHLGAKSSTTRSEASPAEVEMLKVHIPRILGLVVMNCFRITAFNGLRTLFFNLPPELPLHSYSFRAMASMTPVDHGSALAAVQVPLLLVAGSKDEAFVANAYEAEIRGHGTVTIIPDATHDGVMTDARTMAAVHAWMGEV